MKTFAPAFLRVVSHGGTFLMARIWFARWNPIQNQRIGQGTPEPLRRSTHPRRAFFFRHTGQETAQRVVAHDAFQAEQFIECGIFTQPLNVGKATAIAEHRQAQAGQHVVNGRGIGTGPRDRQVLASSSSRPDCFWNAAQRNQSAIGRQRVIRGAEPDVAPVGRKGKTTSPAG